MLIYTENELTRKISFGSSIIAFAENQSREDARQWLFLYAQIDPEMPNKCIAHYNLNNDKQSELTFLYEVFPRENRYHCEIITKKYTGQDNNAFD